MSIIQQLKVFFTPSHTKLLIAFVVIYIGTVFPQQMVLCQLIASYLGINILVSGAQAYGASLKK